MLVSQSSALTYTTSPNLHDPHPLLTIAIPAPTTLDAVKVCELITSRCALTRPETSVREVSANIARQGRLGVCIPLSVSEDGASRPRHRRGLLCAAARAIRVLRATRGTGSWRRRRQASGNAGSITTSSLAITGRTPNASFANVCSPDRPSSRRGSAGAKRGLDKGSRRQRLPALATTSPTCILDAAEVLGSHCAVKARSAGPVGGDPPPAPSSPQRARVHAALAGAYLDQVQVMSAIARLYTRLLKLLSGLMAEPCRLLALVDRGDTSEITEIAVRRTSSVSGMPINPFGARHSSAPPTREDLAINGRLFLHKSCIEPSTVSNLARSTASHVAEASLEGVWRCVDVAVSDAISGSRSLVRHSLPGTIPPPRAEHAPPRPWSPPLAVIVGGHRAFATPSVVLSLHYREGTFVVVQTASDTALGSIHRQWR
ncbi:hypothetical protein AURDEDRAFT_176196 [Auricularia subglabra TFB-10046 SS5]|uniref:Uncharacterized protein n=1 Tax=Auricularia subglabra (strain TFB-10046 / SS5) TaxID=717982 RepID=J0D727_AURST|nr:hypothetical protein AURDEDRAFT_176196 [Auricularia subglabra TFB-10046 SS5]